MKITISPEDETFVPVTCACCVWLRVSTMDRPHVPGVCPVDGTACALVEDPGARGGAGPVLLGAGTSADKVWAANARGRRLFTDDDAAFLAVSVHLAVLMPEIAASIEASGLAGLP